MRAVRHHARRLQHRQGAHVANFLSHSWSHFLIFLYGACFGLNLRQHGFMYQGALNRGSHVDIAPVPAQCQRPRQLRPPPPLHRHWRKARLAVTVPVTA